MYAAGVYVRMYGRKLVRMLIVCGCVGDSVYARTKAFMSGDVRTYIYVYMYTPIYIYLFNGIVSHFLVVLVQWMD